MADPIDLTGDIAAAIDRAALRGATVAVAYVRSDGSPSVSLRASLQVHSKDQLAMWARKPDSGLAAEIGERPRLSMVYFEPGGPGPMYLSIEGRARVAPEVNDQVFATMIDGEQQQDAERKGVAVIIDVDSVTGAGAGGLFQQART